MNTTEDIKEAIPISTLSIAAPTLKSEPNTAVYRLPSTISIDTTEATCPAIVRIFTTSFSLIYNDFTVMSRA